MSIHRDPKRPKATHIALGIAASLAMIGGYVHFQDRPPPLPQTVAIGPTPNVSVIAAGDDRQKTIPAVTVTTSRESLGLSPTQTKSADYATLTAPGATPEMLAKAYVYAKDCINERLAYQGGLEMMGVATETHPQAAQKCALGPGDPDNATWKRVLEARVKLNAYGAISDVLDAHRTAFADDPEGWKRLYNEAYMNGLKGAEPVALSGESVTAYMEGDYHKAAVYAIASAIGRAQEAGASNVDLDKEHRVVEAMQKLPADQRPLVIIEGQELARKWRKVS